MKRKRRTRAHTVYIASEAPHARPTFTYKTTAQGRIIVEGTAYGRTILDAETRAREAFDAARKYVALVEAAEKRASEAKTTRQLGKSVVEIVEIGNAGKRAQRAEGDNAER